MAISNSFTYIAFLMFIAGSILVLEKKSGWKVFRLVPALVWIYLINMAFCTIGLYSSEACDIAYGAVKNNILYAMIFVMLLRCDIRKLFKMTGRMAAIFLGSSLSIGIGFVIGYPIFRNYLGNDTVGAVSALFASWIGGSASMAAMQDAFPVDSGAFGCALALDTVCYSLWIAILLFSKRFEGKWNKAVKADTGKLDGISLNIDNQKNANTAKVHDWLFLIGISLLVSAVCQWLGAKVSAVAIHAGLTLFDTGTFTTLIVTVLGLICAMTPLGKALAKDDLSEIYLYAVISLLASRASLTELVSAPMWVVFGLFILAVHTVVVFLLSKLFHWDMCMNSIASLANIGGQASASVIATTYNRYFVAIGIIMGIFGEVLGNFAGLGMYALLRFFGSFL